jgi:hypothetical protein
MNQQEIKNNLHLPFYNLIDNDNAIDGIGLTIVDSKWIGEAMNECQAMNYAIVHAINNTYGKGINPESVPDMFNALQSLHRDLINYGSYKSAEIIQNIIKKATK